MNAEDPYAGLLLEMDKRAKSQQPPGLLRGTVLDVGVGRLVVRAGGMTLDEHDLMVNAQLLARREVPYQIVMNLKTSSVKLDIGGKAVQTKIQTASELIESIPLYDLPGTLTGTVTGTVALDSDRLAPGDQVLLLPDAEGQTYYVLFKVVSP